MSALGQKRTHALQQRMSALGQKRTHAVHYKVPIKHTFSAGSVFQKYRFSGGGPALLEHQLEKEAPMSRATKAATFALSIAFAGITVVDAMAGNWGQNHPRRDVLEAAGNDASPHTHYTSQSNRASTVRSMCDEILQN